MERLFYAPWLLTTSGTSPDPLVVRSGYKNTLSPGSGTITFVTPS